MTEKNRAAVELGRLGGQKTAAKMTPEEKKERARKAGRAYAEKLYAKKRSAPKN